MRWRPWVLAGILGGLAGALRIPFGVIPSVQPSTAMVVLVGQAFGPWIGAVVGILVPLVSNTVLGHGPWTLFQMAGWGLVGLLSGLLPRLGRTPLAVLGFLLSYLFGTILDVWVWLAFAKPYTLTTLLPVLVRGVPFNIAHGATTAAVLLAVGPRLDALFARARVRILGRGPRPALRSRTTTVKSDSGSNRDVEERGPDASDGPPDKVGGKKRRAKRPARPHPYRAEPSTPEEEKVDARRVTYLWLLGSLAMVVLGYWAQGRYGWNSNQSTLHPSWELWNGIPLFAGILLLGLSLAKVPRRHEMAMVGWVLFSAYWAMTARDLFIREENDYVNMTAAMVAVFALNYFSYHEWLNIKRGVTNFATRYMAVVAVVAAGVYFLIAKVTPFRVWLIKVVGDQTRWMLDRFGLGSPLGLQFHIDRFDFFGPVLFHYPDTYCNASRGDPIGEYCATLPAEQQYVTTYPDAPTNWFESLVQYAPDGDLRIIPVSIILACTAIQTIALFAGLFLGTKAPLKKRLAWTAVVGAAIYVLNLMRNSLVIWAYGRGHMSFFMVHNVLAKVLTLGALIAIAFYAFKRFPQFFHALGEVLDLPHRDGPIERTLRLGRRRPEAAASTAAGIPVTDGGPEDSGSAAYTARPVSMRPAGSKKNPDTAMVYGLFLGAGHLYAEQREGFWLALLGYLSGMGILLLAPDSYRLWLGAAILAFTVWFATTDAGKAARAYNARPEAPAGGGQMDADQGPFP